MRLFPPEMEIDPAEGFTPQKDIFGRREFGVQLTRLVRGMGSPSVFLLDAPWGTGKSTFVKMWRGELHRNGIASIYFDAFANDYQQDAFIAVASQIIAEAELQKSKTSKILKTFKKNALKTAKVLVRASVGLGIRAATAGLIDAEALKGAAADLSKGLSEDAAKLTDEALKIRLESHESDRKAFDDFRGTLAELAIALSSRSLAEGTESNSELDDESQTTPLVFIIDELDRCRPTFALELLEKIKHFFSVPGVTFLLVSSFAQLESAVRFAYGNIDAQTYLEKFYHLKILMPAGTANRLDLSALTYSNFLGLNQRAAQIMDEFCRVNLLSLRTLERIVTYWKIIELSVPKGGLRVHELMIPLCIIKVLRPPLYELIRSSKAKFAAVNNLLRFDEWRTQYNPSEPSSSGQGASQWWLFALDEMRDQATLSRFQNELFRYGTNQSTILASYCQLADGFQFPDKIISE